MPLQKENVVISLKLDGGEKVASAVKKIGKNLDSLKSPGVKKLTKDFSDLNSQLSLLEKYLDRLPAKLKSTFSGLPLFIINYGAGSRGGSSPKSNTDGGKDGGKYRWSGGSRKSKPYTGGRASGGFGSRILSMLAQGGRGFAGAWGADVGTQSMGTGETPGSSKKARNQDEADARREARIRRERRASRVNKVGDAADTQLTSMAGGRMTSGVVNAMNDAGSAIMSTGIVGLVAGAAIKAGGILGGMVMNTIDRAESSSLAVSQRASNTGAALSMLGNEKKLKQYGGGIAGSQDDKNVFAGNLSNTFGDTLSSTATKNISDYNNAYGSIAGNRVANADVTGLSFGGGMGGMIKGGIFQSMLNTAPMWLKGKIMESAPIQNELKRSVGVAEKNKWTNYASSKGIAGTFQQSTHSTEQKNVKKLGEQFGKEVDKNGDPIHYVDKLVEMKKQSIDKLDQLGQDLVIEFSSGMADIFNSFSKHIKKMANKAKKVPPK